MYSLMLKAVNGKYFDANTTVTFKDKTVNASNTSVSKDGKTLLQQRSQHSHRQKSVALTLLMFPA